MSPYLILFFLSRQMLNWQMLDLLTFWYLKNNKFYWLIWCSLFFPILPSSSFYCFLFIKSLGIQITLIVSLDSSGDELWPAAERLLPPAAAGPHCCVPAHEDAQEDPGTLVIRVLRDLWQDRTTHLHSRKNTVVFVCVLCVWFVSASRTVPCSALSEAHHAAWATSSIQRTKSSCVASTHLVLCCSKLADCCERSASM